MNWDLEEAISYYKKQGAPKDQSVVTALLREIQSQHGGSIPSGVLIRLAEAYETKESYFLALIRRIPSLRLSDKHLVELCAGPNCGKHRALADFAEKNCRGKAELKFVPCMRQCGKGPNLRFDGKLYHKADEALLKSLLDTL